MKIEKTKTETDRFELTFTRQEVLAALETHFKQKIPHGCDIIINPSSWNQVDELEGLRVTWATTQMLPPVITEEPKPITREDIENWPREMPG